MKQYLDKFKRNKKRIMLLLVISIIGIISGAIFVTILNKSDSNLVTSYLSDFFTNINNNKFNYNQAFVSTIINNISFISIIWLLGISIIGIPIIALMYFGKAFSIGFILSAFISNYKFKGILYALVYLFPHHIVNILVYTILTMYSLMVSIKIIKSIINKESINFRAIIRFYSKILLFSLIIVGLTSLYEIYVVPNILKVLIK